MAITPKIHSSSILYLVICVVGIAVFFLVGIYPNSVTMAELNQDAEQLQFKLSAQELLFPVYSALIKEVQQQTPDLPLPENTTLSRQQIANIDSVFMGLAERNHVMFVMLKDLLSKRK